jgi:hypothetical protein
MAQTSDELREEIEHTRERMGDTADALAYKANVPKRTKNWLGEKKDTLVGKVSDATPDTGEAKQKAGRVKRGVERNPLGLAIGGAAAGFIAGLLAPSTRVEDEKLGPVADEVKSQAAEAGREAVERGATVAQEAGQTALETAKERGREQGEELTESLQEKAKEATSSSASETTTAPTQQHRAPSTTPRRSR